MQGRTAQCAFLSRVNDEFGASDGAVGKRLGVGTSANSVVHQTGFAQQQAGHGLLRKLLDHMRLADVVIHYVGRALGTAAGREEVEAFLMLEPRLRRWLSDNGLAHEGWSYTQWEAYMAIFLQREERVANAPPALLFYAVAWHGEVASAEVQRHCDEVGKWHKGIEAIALPAYAASDPAALAMILVDSFRNSTVAWPSPRRDGLTPDQEVRVTDLLGSLVRCSRLSCAEIIALAFPLCQRVIGLEISRLQVRHFIANLVDHLNGRPLKGDIVASWVHLHAIRMLLESRDADASRELGMLLDQAGAECGLQHVELVKNYDLIYPDCFPHYPLSLCVEVYVQKLAEAMYSVSISYRVGDHRQFVLQEAVEGRDPDCVDDPCKAIALAFARTADTTARLGGFDRFEFLPDRTMLDTDEAWRRLATARWHDAPADPFVQDADPVVLRWPHTDRSANLLKRIAAGSRISLRGEMACDGAHVERGDLATSPLDGWKIALMKSTLMLWALSADAPLPHDADDFHWSDAPRRLREPSWQHVGMAINPPEAPVYRPAGHAAARMNPRIQRHLR